MLIVLIALFAVALIAPWIFRYTDRSGFLLLAIVPASGFIWLCTQLPRVLRSDDLLGSGSAADTAGDSLVRTYEWVPSLGMELSFRLDTLAIFMGLIVLGVGAAVLVYCARYFTHGSPRIGLFGALMVAFAGTMFGLVTTDDLLILYIFWEITSILSFLLIGHSGHRIFARRSAITALIVTTLGGLAMLVGLLMMGEAAGSYRVSEIINAAPDMLSGPHSGAFMSWAIALVLLGALSKSAQVPFHFWLPQAMAAPTPVSAYLHAAAMVKAGIYLVARLAPAFSGENIWQALVLGVGMWSMLVGGWRALTQTDVKLVLAYGTVSQLGFLMIANGLGTPDAAMAGLAMLLAHSLFKAPLFMVVGLIDQKTGTRDLNKLSGLWRSQRALFGTALVASASMAGIPPLFGFVAKESVLESALDWGSHHSDLAASHANPDFWGQVWAWAPLVVAVLGSVLTVAYTCRFVWGAFATKKSGVRSEQVIVPTTPVHRETGKLGLAPAMVLAICCLIAAFIPGWVGVLPEAYAETFPTMGQGDHDSVAHLALWHGFTPVLFTSAGIILIGLLMFAARDRVNKIQSSVPEWLDAAKGYQRIIAKLDDFAVWLTGRTQRGELSFYLFIILLVAVVGPLISMAFPANSSEGSGEVRNAASQAKWVLTESPALVAAGVVMVVAVLATLMARKRFMAVMLVSVTGYGLAAIFALQGAPDLALTQLLVESIVLVAMVLGLRVLPARVRETTGRNNRWARALLAIGFGLMMMWVAGTVLASRVADPISLKMPDMAYEEGGGSNIVNVTLVDIRAWDTFGEITVLAAAATGVASLVFIQQRERRRRQLTDVASESVGRVRSFGSAQDRGELATVRRFASSANGDWLEASRTLAPERRSIIFEVITRLIFHAIMLVSIYLLLAGHNTPGGGFAGGLLAGLALTIRYLAGGRYELQQAMPVPAGVILGSGLGIAALSGIAPLFFGGEVFQQVDVEVDMWLFGHVHFASAVVFDIGVYLVVIGLVIDVLRSLGSEVDRRGEADVEAKMQAARRRSEVRAKAGKGPVH